MRIKRGYDFASLLLPTVSTVFLSYLSFSCLGETIGVATIPSDIIKATILIERVETRKAKQYVPLNDLLIVVQNQSGRPTSIPTTNIFTYVDTEQTIFYPLGSGCLLVYSNVYFVVTAGHVVPADGDVHFRVVRTNTIETTHYSHLQDKRTTGLGWVRSTNADLAITSISLVAAQDDVKCIDFNALSATYDQVTLGDAVFVVGYPALVTEIRNPNVRIIRSGMVASKLGNDMILVDGFAFPGNSGGPVFWKPSMGIKFGSGIKFSGGDIPGREPSLVGIVLASQTYVEEAVSKKTDRTRITFEENSGLTSVVSSSKIMELLNYPEILNWLANRK